MVNEWIKEGQKLTAEQTDSINLEEEKAESDNITVSVLRLLVQVMLQYLHLLFNSWIFTGFTKENGY